MYSMINKLTFTGLSLLLLSASSGCAYDEDCSVCGEDCTFEACTFKECPARSGEATLEARTLADDYQAATVSFERATVVDEGQVLNDWDLLFGNDRMEEEDWFSVNMVVDDRSSIFDFGPVRFTEVPWEVNPDDHELGAYSEHDDIVVHLGHVYLVQTLDDDSWLETVFRVVDHRLNQSVTIQWARRR
jgi:hypothetical protein